MKKRSGRRASVADDRIGRGSSMTMRSLLLICLSLGVVSSLRVLAPLPRTSALSRTRSPVAMADEESEEERRQRLEALGREEAALDAAADDGGLMAEFNKRLDDEGGATAFKAKVAVSDAQKAATDTAERAKMAGEDLADTVSGWTNSLTEQQRKIGTIVLGLIAFNLFINFLATALR